MMSWIQFVNLVFLFLVHPIIGYDVYVKIHNGAMWKTQTYLWPRSTPVYHGIMIILLFPELLNIHPLHLSKLVNVNH